MTMSNRNAKFNDLQGKNGPNEHNNNNHKNEYKKVVDNILKVRELTFWFLVLGFAKFLRRRLCSSFLIAVTRLI